MVDTIDVIPTDDTMPTRTELGFVVPLLMDSYQRKNGRTFDAHQVAAMAEGFLDMANTINMGVAYTQIIENLVFKMGESLGLGTDEVYNIFAQINQGVAVEDIEIKKRKFWTP